MAPKQKPVREFNVKVRRYGWYCSRCKEHKTHEGLYVAGVAKSAWIKVVCKLCNTELIDCRRAKKYYKIDISCDDCQDKFNCFSMSDADISLPLIKVSSHQVHPVVPLENEEKYGIKSYTGKVYDKLETDSFCRFTERDDCNHSYMRANYTGEGYRRCVEMKYDPKEKKWYCRYGRLLRE